MTNPSASSVLGKFIWYDQMSNDLPGAEKFYSKVVGWTIAPNTMNAQRYSLLQAGEGMVGGLSRFPKTLRRWGCARHGWAISRSTTSRLTPTRSRRPAAR